MTQPSGPAQTVKVIVELIDHTTKIAEVNERGDLVERMARAKERITDPQIRVVIAGQLKQGKSQLLNSLLNVPVARVGDDESTVLATMVSFGENATAKLIVARGRGWRARGDRDPDGRHQDRPAPRTRKRVAGKCCGSRSPPPAHCSRTDLAFVDTPGVGGHGQPHLSATLGLLPDADAHADMSATPARSSPSRR